MNGKKENKISNQPKKAKATDPCEKYGIAITDYILGEEMDIPREELFTHLAACEHCRKDLANWRDTYSAMRNKAYMEKPETKKKYQEMLARIKSSASSVVPSSQCSAGDKLQGGIDININKEYGWHAGILWSHLGENGPTKEEDIPAKIQADKDKAKVLTGWLMGEKKVCMKQINQDKYIYLTKEEQEKYNQVKDKTIGQAEQPRA